MNKKTLFVLPICAVAASQPAYAQSIPGIQHDGSTVTLSFNFHDDYDDQPYTESYTTFLSAASSYRFGGNVGLTLTLGYVNETYEEEFYSERYSFDINPTYTIGDGTVGLYYSAVASNDGDWEDHANYGLTGTFESGPLSFEAYAGIREKESEFADDTYGFAAGYSFTDDVSAYFTYQRDTESDGDFDALTAIGISYDLTSLASVPVTISGEIGLFTDEDLSLSEAEGNHLAVTASYNFGGGSESFFQGLRAWDYYYD